MSSRKEVSKAPNLAGASRTNAHINRCFAETAPLRQLVLHLQPASDNGRLTVRTISTKRRYVTWLRGCCIDNN